MSQTQENTESLALQYELRRHATALGWSEQQITVIDEDLARSAASTSGRLGFTDLVAAVGLGKVGIIVGREVSRLARNNTDRYQVLDLCSVTDTLIADADGIYHPGSFNDRLVLGLKGQMAEAELHMPRMRLTEALRHKALSASLRDAACPLSGSAADRVQAGRCAAQQTPPQRASIGCVTAAPRPSTPVPDTSPFEVIHLGGEAAVVVPVADFLRLQALQRHASAEELEEAEIEATLAAHRAWVAAGRPGAVSHEEAMAELLGGRA